MADVNASQLGRATDYPQSYDPSVLFPVERAVQRRHLGASTKPAFTGTDRWLAFEVSWLDSHGVPRYALGQIDVPAGSPALIESKSLKLYLNSLNMTRFESTAEVCRRVEADLAAVAGAAVHCELWSPEQAMQVWTAPEFLQTGRCLDSLPLTEPAYEVDPGLLRLAEPGAPQEDGSWLYTHLLRSNCPVTGQPDWGTLALRLRGPGLDHSALLAYLVSYRSHTGFHEHCVEQIFTDLAALGAFTQLDVWALYTRRGGLAINPWRSLSRAEPPAGALFWQ